MLNINDFKINLEIKEQKNMLALVEIRIPPVVVTGFRVMKSEFGDGLFVQVPSVATRTGKYLWIFKIEDKLLWKEFEAKVKEIYRQKKQEYDEQNSNDFETDDGIEIDPDTLPF